MTKSVESVQSVKASIHRVPVSAFREPERKHRLLISLLLVAITLVLYQPVKNFDFINYDDPFYVTRNIPVQSGLNAKSIAWAFTAVEIGNWHPLTWLSHMLDCELFGTSPAGHHFMSVLLHAANAVLLFLLLCAGTGRTWPSALVALLFAVHPLNVQSVAWVSERKNLLSTTFWFLTVAAYGYYVRKPNWKRYSSVLVFFVLGLLSKAMLVTLPFVLLLLDYWPLRRRMPVTTLFGSAREEQGQARRLALLVAEKVPLMLITLASTWITYRTQRMHGRPDLELLFPFWFRMQNALFSYFDYLWKTVWPTDLAVFYPLLPLRAWQPLLAGVVLLLITILVLKFRTKAYLPVGWFWYLGTLVPVIGLIQVGMQSRADRYAYVPLIGIFVMVAWGLAYVIQRWNRAIYIVLPLLACAISLLCWDTRVQLAYWRDSITVFSRALAVTPENNYLSQMNLAVGLQEAGRPREALPYMKYVAEHFPNNASVRNDLGSVLREVGMLADAVQNGNAALKLTDNPRILARIHSNLGLAFRQMGQTTIAKEHFSDATRLDPLFFGARLSLAKLLYAEGQFAQAASEAKQSLAIVPSVEGYLMLGEALLRDNKPAEALAAFREGLRISPGERELQERVQILQQQIQSSDPSRR